VAIKKISDALLVPLEAKRLLREIALLRRLRHRNVIALLDILPPSDSAGFRDLYLVYELMDTDLYAVIRSAQPLTEAHTAYFTWQLFCGLRYLHAAGVIHRDVNPANLLVNASCRLKIADFGLARPALRDANDGEGKLSAYVVTRWYRAPELLLCAPRYGVAVDLWAAGCVLAELLGRRALLPGRDTAHQLALVLGVVGTPEPAALARASSPAGAAYAAKLPAAARVSFRHLYPSASDAATALLDALLVFDPDGRCSAQDALAHPFFAAYAAGDEAAEAAAASAQAPPRSDFEFEFERATLDECAARTLLLAEVAALRSDAGRWSDVMPESAASGETADALASAMARMSADVARTAAAAATAAFAASPAAARRDELRPPSRSPEPPMPPPPKSARGGGGALSAIEGASSGVVLQPRSRSVTPPQPRPQHAASPAA
jgi:hypothetical protein